MANNQPTLPSSIAGQPSINYRESDLDSPKKAIFLHKVQDTDSSEEIHAIQKINRIAVPTKDVALTESSSKKQNTYLYGILALNLLMCFGMNYVFDFPQALEDPLIRKLRVDPWYINLLYAVSALPNILLYPFVSYLISHMGCHLSALVYGSCVFFGQLTIFFGVRYCDYWWIFTGRALIGCGTGGLKATVSKLSDIWFYGRFRDGVNLWSDIFTFLGVVIGNISSPAFLMNKRDLEAPFFAMSIVCTLSITTTLAYYYMHKRNKEYLEKLAEGSSGLTITSPGEETPEDDSSLEGIHFHHPISPKRFDQPLLESEEEYTDNTGRAQLPRKQTRRLEIIVEEDSSVQNHTIEFDLSPVKEFGWQYWLLCLTYMILTSCYFQFTNLISEFLMNRYFYEYHELPALTIVPAAAFIISSPFISRGALIIGGKTAPLIICSLLYALCFLSLYSLPPSRQELLYFILSLLGVSHSLSANIQYSLLCNRVDREDRELGYDFLVLFEYLGLTIFPVYFGSVVVERSVEAMDDCLLRLVLLSTLGIIFSAVLFISDTKPLSHPAVKDNSKVVKKIKRNTNGNDFLAERSLKGSNASRSGKVRGGGGAASPNQSSTPKKHRRAATFSS